MAIGVLLVGQAVFMGASREQAAPVRPEADGITGQLLVATTRLRDPRFVRTVIYMIRADARGAMGLVVNLPLSGSSLAAFLKQLGIEGRGIKGGAVLHHGGPMESGRPFVLHTSDYTIEGTKIGASGIAVTVGIDVLRAIGAGVGPRRFLVALGRAGWGPRQLEREIAAGVWSVVPADEDLVLDQDDATKWDRAIARGFHPSIHASRPIFLAPTSTVL